MRRRGEAREEKKEGTEEGRDDAGCGGRHEGGTVVVPFGLPSCASTPQSRTNFAYEYDYSVGSWFSVPTPLSPSLPRLVARAGGVYLKADCEALPV